MLMNKMKTRFSIRMMLVGLMACSMMSCEGDLDLNVTGPEGTPHDSSKPVAVTKFVPTTGGAGQQMVIYGENFGNDPSIIKVTVGGTEAVVVNALGNELYCIVPAKPAADVIPEFNAPIEGEDDIIPEANDPAPQQEDESANARSVYVAVGPQGSMKVAAAEAKFEYERVLRVTTFAGVVNDKNEWEVKDGPLNDCGNFPQGHYFAWDPVDPSCMYFSHDGGPLRVIDFDYENPDGSKGYVKTLFNSNFYPYTNRMRSVSFTSPDALYPDGNGGYMPAGTCDMLIAEDTFDNGAPAVMIIKRKELGMKGMDAFYQQAPEYLACEQACNGAYCHPVTGDIYFNSYIDAEIFRYPAYLIYDDTDDRTPDLQFNFGEHSFEFNNVIHPTGNYMMLVMINRHYLAKSLYDPAKKNNREHPLEKGGGFVQPTNFLGSDSTMGLGGGAGYLDDIGLSAKCNQPRQGVFVYNPAYAGQEDEYDFYFTDANNHCIRKITPQGIASTYAGRGNNQVNGFADGLARQEALFNYPCGLTYLPDTDEFLVADLNNKRIRKIYWE